MFLSVKPINQGEIESRLTKDVQYRKELSIAFFNATNSAIALITSSLPKTATIEKKLAQVSEVREHFLNEYKSYRVNTLDTVGKGTIDPKVTPGLEKAKQSYEGKS